MALNKMGNASSAEGAETGGCEAKLRKIVEEDLRKKMEGEVKK